MSARAPDTIFLSLGSNLGRRKSYLEKALALLAANGVCVKRMSSLYLTTPIGFKFQPSFLNRVICAETSLSPFDLLSLIQRIERKLWRTRFFKNAPRTIDIDLLFYNNTVMDDPRLTIPHPRIAERAFVLIPMMEIAPQFRHPVLELTVGQMLASINKIGVTKW